MLDTVPGGAYAGEAELLGRRADAVDHGAHGGVADRVEARLEARLGAGDHMGGDRVRVEVRGAGVGGVGVRLVQAGGVRAQGAVGEQVPGRAERAQLAGLGDVLLGPVADHARAGFLAGESQQAGEVVLGGDLGAAALVHRADAEGGRVREGGALGGGALRGGDGAQGGGAHRVVVVAGERAVLAGHAARDEVEQGGGDDGGVHVDAAEVERAAPGGLVEFRARGGPAAGPAGGVPAVPEEHPVVGAGGGELPHPGEGVLQGGGGGQVEAGEGEPGGGGVDVRVGERGGDERPVEVDHLVDTVREGVGGALGTHPGDLSALDDHRGGEGVGGAVDLSATEQDGGRRGGTFTHALSFARRAGAPARRSPSTRAEARGGAPPGVGALSRPRQMRGGRASYGVESTTVVRVDTPARERTLARSSSSSCGVATRTLRM
ncbi:hypothetical protein SALBM217S_09618 [Streptomyces griseoloalbus]